MPPEEEDPVIASHDVYITAPKTGEDSRLSSKLYVLQYPSHRPSSKPYSSSRSQKPASFRIRPNTGIFEVDVPILTSDNYNASLGDQLGRAMHESRLAHPTTSHGLAGGFAQNPSNQTHLNDVPEHGGLQDSSLQIQTLGGKASIHSDRDPVYMLATLNKSREIHLSHLDAVVQMRPQLHHIDAIDEVKRRAETATKVKPESSSGGAVKLETKAIEMKLKDSTREDPKDRNLNINARLLRDIQNDPWQKYEWVEKSDDAFTAATKLPTTNTAEGNIRKLKSALDNDEWLNRMSSPGIELRTRLKGRDRERARRKRQERLRAAKADTSTNAVVGPFEQDESDESSGSEDEDDDAGNETIQGMERPGSPPPVQIKQESNTATTTLGSTPNVGDGAASVPKKRGRPKKQADGGNVDA